MTTNTQAASGFSLERFTKPIVTPLRRFLKWYRGTPFGRSVPKEWVRPSDVDYALMQHYEGFIVPEHWEDDDLKTYPAIKQDLKDLEEYLLPVFWEFNQRSRYYQHNYYYYQWVFIIGAFATTVLAVMTTFFSGQNVSLFGIAIGTVVIFGWNSGLEVVTLFSVITTIVSAVTSYFTILSNQGEPRKRWASYRRLAEELRMVYFRFISRLEPYNTKDRVEQMRRRVLEIREQEETSA
ncbi:MAG: DUF4231 domain-containing protein [Phototrophicaceae bacterium]|jgi:hypothetical protein